MAAMTSGKTGNISLFNTSILGFHTIPGNTKDNRRTRSGHVGVPNKRNNQNSIVKSTPT